MAYSATLEGSNYAVYQDGKRVSTTAASGLSRYGLSESTLSTPTQQATSTPQQTFNGYITTGTNSGQLATNTTTTSGYGTGTYTQPTQQAPQPTTQTSTQPTAQTSTTQPQQQVQPLTMPSNGSVVDLLNAAGTDSSFAARAQLAKQYGIQGYTGTAQQNTDLSKKYLEAYNANKGTTVPNTGAEAASAMDKYFEEQNVATEADAEKTFFDEYAAMNPAIKLLYDQINSALAPSMTEQSLREEFASAFANPNLPVGIPGESLSQEQVKYLNLKNVMEGTEDDLRAEIEKSGGFATDSQVLALTGARNKVLMKQANLLLQSMSLKEDYINNLMNFSKLDREAVEKQVDRKLGLTEKLLSLQEKMNTAEKGNYDNVVKAVGYVGLAGMLVGDIKGLAKAEKALGLPKGALSNAAFLSLAKTSSSNGPTSVQEYEYAKRQGYTGSFTDYQNEDANRKRSIAAAGVANDYGMNPRQATLFTTLADRMNKSPLVAANDRAKILKTITEEVAIDPKNASLQVAFIYAMIQALDTYQSATREGEIGLIKGTQGLKDRLTNLPDQIERGTILNPNVIKEYVATARTLTTAINSAAASKQQQFAAQAEISGIGPAFNQLLQMTGGDTGGQIIIYNGKRYQTDAQGNFDPNKPLQ